MQVWLPNPVIGTKVCGGFDGSENNDWTAIRLETVRGFQFTPRYGPDDRPAIWNPAEWGGIMPRSEVLVAMAEINVRYQVERFYCDIDPYWRSQIGEWAVEYGERVYLEWPTNQHKRMHDALKRFSADLATTTIAHDGCPITATHMGNARKKAVPADRFVLMKPAGADHQKIDATMSSVLAHEAAFVARAACWNYYPTVSYGIAFALQRNGGAR